MSHIGPIICVVHFLWESLSITSDLLRIRKYFTFFFWHKTESLSPPQCQEPLFNIAPSCSCNRADDAWLVVASWKSVVSQWPRSTWRLAPGTTTVFTVSLQSRSGHVSLSVCNWTLERWDVFIVFQRGSASQGGNNRIKDHPQSAAPPMLIPASALTHLVR